MANHGDLSPEARERAHRTVLVADVFADNADTIVAALLELPDGHVLVAIVDSAHAFDRVHHVDRADRAPRGPARAREGGWVMVFSAGTSADEIRKRTDQMASLAAQRAATIDRINARKQP